MSVEGTPVDTSISGVTDVLRVDAVMQDSTMNVTLRNGTLYNITDQTNEFDNDIQLDIVRFLEWDNLSLPLQTHITKSAAVEFHRRKIGGRTQDAYLQQEAAIAKAAALKSDGANADYNVLETPAALRMKGHRFTIPRMRY